MKLIYKIHKWIGIIFGIILFLWILTGMGFLLPRPNIATQQIATLSEEELSSVSLTPVEAVQELNKIKKSSPSVRSIVLKKVDGKLMYKINVKGGKPFLLNADSGKLFTITPEIAERIAKNHLLKKASVSQVILVKRRNASYPFGPLPAYGIVFDDQQNTIVCVSTIDGKVTRISNDRIKLLSINHDIHNLKIIMTIINSKFLIKFLVISFSVILIIGTITGYLVSFPIRLRKKNKI